MASRRTNYSRLLALPCAVLAVVVAVFFSPGVFAQATEVTLTDEQLSYISILALMVLFALGYVSGRMR